MTHRTWLAAVITAACALAPAVAMAERYRVDLILYADKTGSGGEAPVPARLPELTRTFDPGDTTQLRAAGIDILPDDAFGLSKEWKHLANSQRHQPLLRLAWLQKDPPSENGPGLRLRSGAPMVLNTSGPQGTRSSELYPVDGSVRLLMGRFLHLDADLGYTVSTESGEPATFRLQERRRMRREELHHLDSPRLGLLVKVRKFEDKPKP